MTLKFKTKTKYTFATSLSRATGMEAWFYDSLLIHNLL